MNLAQFKTHLQNITEITFQLSTGKKIPAHFHITEVGQTTKKFIDCGGKIRTKNVINFQIWTALDFDHRLKPSKLLNIIQIAQKNLSLDDRLDIEAEFQQKNIGLFGIKFKDDCFLLTNQYTNCLATDKCGIDTTQLPQNNCCSNSGCC